MQGGSACHLSRQLKLPITCEFCCAPIDFPKAKNFWKIIQRHIRETNKENGGLEFSLLPIMLPRDFANGRHKSAARNDGGPLSMDGQKLIFGGCLQDFYFFLRENRE
jgi:hypothetical protein